MGKLKITCRGCMKFIEINYKPKGKNRKEPKPFMKMVDPKHFKHECK